MRPVSAGSVWVLLLTIVIVRTRSRSTPTLSLSSTIPRNFPGNVVIRVVTVISKLTFCQDLKIDLSFCTPFCLIGAERVKRVCSYLQLFNWLEWLAVYYLCVRTWPAFDFQTSDTSNCCSGLMMWLRMLSRETGSVPTVTVCDSLPSHCGVFSPYRGLKVHQGSTKLKKGRRSQ